MDGQVKLRGLRIELGEIESQMLSYEGIINATVAVKEISGAEHLCAYYTAESEIDAEELTMQMATKLTAFMIPTSFTKLDQFPLTSNGKVNKKALPNPVIGRQEFVSPQNETEQQLFDLIATIVGTTNFGVTDDLFSMGLTSILATIISNAEETIVETLAKRDYYPLTENQLGLYYE